MYGRWSEHHSAVHITDLPHTLLTSPVKVFDFDFGGPVGALPPREALLGAPVVTGGIVTDVMVWFDLHLTSPDLVLTSGGCVGADG
jgi:hypothetical protein